MKLHFLVLCSLVIIIPKMAFADYVQVSYILADLCSGSKKPKKWCDQSCENIADVVVGGMQSVNQKLQKVIADGKVYVAAEKRLSLFSRNFNFEKVMSIKKTNPEGGTSYAELGFKVRGRRLDKSEEHLILDFKTIAYRTMVEATTQNYQTLKIKNRGPQGIDSNQATVISNILCFPKDYDRREFYLNQFKKFILPPASLLGKLQFFITLRAIKD